MSEQDEFFPATAMPDNAWWSALWPEPGDVVRRLGIETGMTVLDLCCGDGYFTAPLRNWLERKVALRKILRDERV